MNGIQWMASQKFDPMRALMLVHEKPKREHILTSELDPEVDREVRRLLKSGYRKSVVARMTGLKYHAVRMIYHQLFGAREK